LETGLRHHLQSWFELLQDEEGLTRRRIADIAEHFTSDDLAMPLKALNEHLSASRFGELGSWPAAARNALLAEIESYRRLVVLMTELNQQFAEIPVATH